MAAKNVTDRKLARQRKLRAAARRRPGDDFLLARVADDLVWRLEAVNRHFGQAVLTGPFGLGDEAVPATAVARFDADALLTGMGVSVVGDEETLPFASLSADLAISFLSLHETNDTPGVLAQYRRMLLPDGLFLAVMPGGDTLHELRTCLVEAEAALTGGASPRILPMIDIRDAGALLQRAGFALPVADLERITVRYDTMFDLIRDLRSMGSTNALTDRSRRPARREMFARAAALYAERFADADGRIRATFSFLWLSGWAPHESQQKPLRPGEGKISLASVLAGRQTK
ncbi:MAG TPA: methyltransferase domain-containing protein [Rhizobiaceae bacterium]|nr:methyltransferase domain-containing protein [Rhizobiaceae bacterium]